MPEADFSADAHKRFFVREDGCEMFEVRLDQQSVSRKQVTPAIIEANQAVYDDWKAKAGMVSVQRDAIEDLNERIRTLESRAQEAEARAAAAEEALAKAEARAAVADAEPKRRGRPPKEVAE